MKLLKKKNTLTENATNRQKLFEIGKSNILIGRFTYGIKKSAIKEWGEGNSLTIGSFCSIAEGVEFFLGGNHRIDWITTFPFGHIFVDHLGNAQIEGHPVSNGDIIVGNDVWFGSNSTIMSGVKIGDGAVIANNAHVVKNVLPYEIVGGCPAKSIRSRFDEKIIDLLLELKWWELPVSVIRDIAPILSQAPTEKILKQLIIQYRS